MSDSYCLSIGVLKDKIQGLTDNFLTKDQQECSYCVLAYWTPSLFGGFYSSIVSPAYSLDKDG